MKKYLISGIISTLFLAVFLTGCSSFVADKTVPTLKEYEKSVYILKQDIKTEKVSLKKDQGVRIVIVPGNEWIKVYAYPEEEELLKSKRALILYIFKDGFPEEKFDMEFFKVKLDEKIQKK